jgi:hypothetical protein
MPTCGFRPVARGEGRGPGRQRTVNGDFVGVPSSQLAVFPGTTHFFGLARTALVLDVVLTFLDARLPES